MAKLKLGAIADDKPVKLTVELPAAVHRDLLAYAKALARETGQPIADPLKLVAPILIANLLRAIGTVAGVAETWQNVGVAVQPLVDRREPDRNVRVNAAHALDAFRRANEAYQSNVVGPALL